MRAKQNLSCSTPLTQLCYARTATLWQGAPTSLRKCVFGGGEVWQHTFAALYSRVSYADKAAFWPVQSNSTFSKTARVNLKTAPSWFFDADRLRFA